MNNPSQGSEPLPRSMENLIQAVRRLNFGDQQALMPLVENVANECRRRRSILTLVQEGLGQLRLDMKYIMFDLEATRRERDEYKEKLEL